MKSRNELAKDTIDWGVSTGLSIACRPLHFLGELKLPPSEAERSDRLKGLAVEIGEEIRRFPRSAFNDDNYPGEPPTWSAAESYASELAQHALRLVRLAEDCADDDYYLVVEHEFSLLTRAFVAAFHALYVKDFYSKTSLAKKTADAVFFASAQADLDD